MGNRNQHYLPAWYLKRFSRAPEKGRQAPIFVHSQSRSFPSTAGAVFKQKDFYADTPRERTREAELHGELEDSLRESMDRLVSGSRREVDLLNVFWNVSYMRLRGVGVGSEQADWSRLQMLEHHGARVFIVDVLGLPAELVDLQRKDELEPRILETLRANWNCSVLEVAGGAESEFVTSDAAAITLRRGHSPILCLLPLGLRHLFVAACKDDLVLRDAKLTNEDVAWVNSAAIQLSVRNVVTAQDPGERVSAEIRKLIGQYTEVATLAADEFTLKSFTLPDVLPSFLAMKAARPPTAEP